MDKSKNKNQVGDKLGQSASLAGKGAVAASKGVWTVSRSILAIVLICTIYLMPTGVAMLKGRTNTLAIFALNLFLGCTVLFWVVALIWALKSDKEKIVVIQQS